jgi:hypothetical protein
VVTAVLIARSISDISVDLGLLRTFVLQFVVMERGVGMKLVMMEIPSLVMDAQQVVLLKQASIAHQLDLETIALQSVAMADDWEQRVVMTEILCKEMAAAAFASLRAVSSAALLMFHYVMFVHVVEMESVLVPSSVMMGISLM